MKERDIKTLEEVKEELKKISTRKQRIRKEYSGNMNSLKINNYLGLNNLKIIGITGSNGKSTVAYIVHEYLKKRGYKSVLYSSCKIDSPSTYFSENDSVEMSFKNESDLLDIIEASDAYGADYLVLEVNERNINNGLVDNIPFTVKALTNLIPEHNLASFSKDEYVNVKKRFFTENRSGINVIGYQGYDKGIFSDFVNIDKENTFTFSSEYIAKLNSIDVNSFDLLLNKLEVYKDKMNFSVKSRLNINDYETNLIFGYNALNLLCALSIIKAIDKKYKKISNINLFNNHVFKNLIKELKIPGRNEIIYKDNSLIIIDTHMTKPLECLNNLKKDGLITKIKVLVGSIGHGYVNWDDNYKTEEYIVRSHKIRENAMKKLDAVDYVYITESDSGKEDALEICNELQSYLSKEVPSMVIVDRKKAIMKAIEELEDDEALLITGRGNREILCDGENHIKLLKDSNVVNEALEELRKKAKI